MTRYISDDRRYMSYEARAAEGDERFVVKPKTEAEKFTEATAKRRARERKAATKTHATCTVVVGGGRKCGKPAVAVFKVGGETFAECEEHAA